MIPYAQTLSSDQERASTPRFYIGREVLQLESEPEVVRIREEAEKIPFEIPKKWKWYSLGEVVDYGKVEQVAPSFIKDNTWVLELEDIEKNTGRLLIKKRGVASTSNKSVFKKGWVLYSKLRPYLNKVIIADEDGICTTEIIPINTNKAKIPIISEYLQIYLMSPYFLSYANQVAHGVKMPRIGTKDAKEALIPIPPIEEQIRISNCYEKLKGLIDAYGKEKFKLKTLETDFPKKLESAILQEAMHGRLVPQLESEPSVDRSFREPQKIPFKIPCKWAWVKFSDVATLLNGRAYSKSELLENAPGRTPVLRVGNLFTKSSWYYSDLELSSDKYCDNGDLLFAWSASFGPKIWDGGKCIYHYHIWKVICSELVDREWLYFWLLAMTNELKNRSGRGSTMIHITKKDTEQVPLALPPIEEQRRIVQTIKSLFMFIEAL